MRAPDQTLCMRVSESMKTLRHKFEYFTGNELHYLNTQSVALVRMHNKIGREKEWKTSDFNSKSHVHILFSAILISHTYTIIWLWIQKLNWQRHIASGNETTNFHWMLVGILSSTQLNSNPIPFQSPFTLKFRMYKSKCFQSWNYRTETYFNLAIFMVLQMMSGDFGAFLPVKYVQFCIFFPHYLCVCVFLCFFCTPNKNTL